VYITTAAALRTLSRPLWYPASRARNSGMYLVSAPYNCTCSLLHNNISNCCTGAPQFKPFGDAPTHGKVTNLPGFGPVKETQYAGYIGLNDTDGSQLFYWFIAADAANWQSLPTVAWYQGGPGAPSLYGWFQENISPYGISASLQIIENPNSWNKVANIICVDNPVGVGFSYTTTGAGYRTTEEEIGQDMDKFYLEFYKRYPFLTGGLYLTGCAIVILVVHPVIFVYFIF
jgi:hypothetical protein